MANLRAIEGGGEDDDRSKDVRAAIDDHIAPALMELENALVEGRLRDVREFALQIKAAADWMLELVPEHDSPTDDEAPPDARPDDPGRRMREQAAQQADEAAARERSLAESLRVAKHGTAVRKQRLRTSFDAFRAAMAAAGDPGLEEFGFGYVKRSSGLFKGARFEPRVVLRGWKLQNSSDGDYDSMGVPGFAVTTDGELLRLGSVPERVGDIGEIDSLHMVAPGTDSVARLEFLFAAVMARHGVR